MFLNQQAKRHNDQRIMKAPDRELGNKRAPNNVATSGEIMHPNIKPNVISMQAKQGSTINLKSDTHEKKDKLQMQTNGAEDAIQMMPEHAINDPIIQKEDNEEDMSISPDAPDMASAVPGICALNPDFPDFRCFLIHLKRNIDTNLYNNAHQFMRIASLYPDDSQMMEDAFMRYGLGVNILETSYQFLGADAGLSTGLAYGTGIGLKAIDFFSKGELMLDFQINLTDDVNLDLQLDLNANPDNLLDIRGASAGIGVSGHF